MELTNHSYLNSRKNYLSSLTSQKLSEKDLLQAKNLTVRELMLVLYLRHQTGESNCLMIVHPL